MYPFRLVRALAMLVVFGVLLIIFVIRLQTWQDLNEQQSGGVESLAFSSQSTPLPSTTGIATEVIVTHTPFPLPMAVNEQGTPFNPFELTPILTIPVVNAEGTPLTATPSAEDLSRMTSVPYPTSTPMIVANAVDLAIGLPDNEIWLIVVLRADGYIDEYRIPASQVLPIENAKDIERYMAFRDTLFQLQPGDLILEENLLTTPMRRGAPISPYDITPKVETPAPPATDVADASSQSDKTRTLHLPQLKN